MPLSKRMRARFKARRENMFLILVFFLMWLFNLVPSNRRFPLDEGGFPAVTQGAEQRDPPPPHNQTVCGIGMVQSTFRVLDRNIDVVQRGLAVGSNSASRQRRLELIHIPKTAGTSLEILAAKYNVSWGACHWRTSVKRKKCPRHPRRPLHHPILPKSRTAVLSIWHVPIFYFYHNIPNPEAFYNPYSNADLFVVVRHPFSRLVSEWNYNLDQRKSHTAAEMNDFLYGFLSTMKEAKPGSPSYFVGGGHYVPQSDFLVGLEPDDNRAVHILRQEHLAEDFECLIKKYRLDWELPKFRFNEASGRLTVADLSERTKKLAQDVYAKDFEMFGYSAY